MIADKIIYCDEPGHRVLDLRPDGVECIPLLSYSDFKAVRIGPDFHNHPGCLEFTLCIKGNLTFDTTEGEYPFLPGYIFASKPTQPHHLRNNPSGLKTCAILFRIPALRTRILGLDTRGSEWIVRSLTHLPKRLFPSTPAVRTAFERLFDIYDQSGHKSPSRRVRMQAAATDLLIAIIDASRHTPRKSSEDILTIAKRIRNAPDTEYKINDLARECSVSVSTFAAEFKRAQGLPLHAYLLNCRINKAKTLLQNSDRTIASIGQELCFCSTQHFARAFRRIVGISPSRFRSAFRPDQRREILRSAKSSVQVQS